MQFVKFLGEAMSTIISGGAAQVDHAGANVITTIGNFVTYPLGLIDRILKDFTDLDQPKKPPNKGEFPTFKNTLLKAKDTFLEYHKWIFKRSIYYSESAKNRVRNSINAILFPCNICQTTVAIRNLISENLSSLVRVVIFCVIQIYHSFPYILGSSILSTMSLLFYASPALTLIAIFTLGQLLTRVYEVYILSHATQMIDKTIDKAADQIQTELRQHLNIFSTIEYSMQQVIKATHKFFFKAKAKIDAYLPWKIDKLKKSELKEKITLPKHPSTPPEELDLH